MLVGFAFLLAFNQVVIKIGNGGFQPVMLAGLRSGLAILPLGAWMLWRGIGFLIPRRTVGWVVLMGLLFAYEFVCLFIALDLTTVGRASIMFYTMPFWTALGAHFLIPGDRLSVVRILGMVLAFAGVAIAMGGAGEDAGPQALRGDFLALVASLGWAGIALILRATPAREIAPVQQLFWQVAVSAPILIGTAFVFGDVWRTPELIHWASLAFQVLAVVSGGYLVWFWLLTIYPASGVASFGFLSPVFSVLLGWALLGEALALSTMAALLLVVAGLWLVNRPPART